MGPMLKWACGAYLSNTGCGGMHMKQFIRSLTQGSSPASVPPASALPLDPARRRCLALLLAACLLLLSACGGMGATSSMQAPAAKNEMAQADRAEYGYSGEEGVAAMPEEPSYSKTDAGGINQPPSAPEALGRKIIRDGRVEMETLEFEATVNGLYQMVAEKGGFVESQTIQGGRYNYSSLRRAQIVIRIPAETFDPVMNAMESLGTVVQKDSSGTDITDQYADTESRVRNLKVQETRILELIAKAEKLEEIVTLEARLSDLRYQIESYENALKNFDRLLTFSRISLNIDEVQRVTDVKPVPKTLGERISQAFDHAWTGLVEGAQDFAVWVVESMFALLFLLILLFIVLQVIRASRRRKRKDKEAWLAAHPQQPIGQNSFPQQQACPPQQGYAQQQGYPMQPNPQSPVYPSQAPVAAPPVQEPMADAPSAEASSTESQNKDNR